MLNWDVPLSFIRRDQTLAYQRPAFGVDVLPRARERVSVSLLGNTLDLVRNGANWVALDGTPGILAREVAGDWTVEDGHGRVFRFSQPALLRNAGLWLLKAEDPPIPWTA
jgi:hypothetical protein